VLNSLPKGTKFDQDYFVDAVLPDLYSEKAQIASRKGLPSFPVHIDNLTCHHSAKITERRWKKHIAHLPHLSDSSDPCPCDFWLFGVLKEKTKDIVSRSEEQILVAINKSIHIRGPPESFQNWMELLIWVIANSCEYYPSMVSTRLD
jgi:hypothetical protein